MYINEYEQKEPSTELKVSKDFLNIYSNFNVVTQVEEMKKLTKRELYLLLTVCLDKFSDEDPVVKHNFLPFREEVMAIFDVQDEKDAVDPVLIDLIKESGDRYIETDYITCDGKNLPEPLTKEEVRDAKINIINK